MRHASRAAVLYFIFELTLPQQAAAYIDPGTTGMLSQVLYVLFYGALGLFFYLLRYVKQYFTNAKQVLVRWLGRRA
ncbi:MAG: hypothetical protein ACREQ2_29385 [Candidatus Binatia bacterium]